MQTNSDFIHALWEVIIKITILFIFFLCGAWGLLEVWGLIHSMTGMLN